MICTNDERLGYGELGAKGAGDLQPGIQRGGYEPDELHRELEGYDLEWITTQSPGDAMEAAKEWRNGLLIVVGGDGTISEVVNGLGRDSLRPSL